MDNVTTSDERFASLSKEVKELRETVKVLWDTLAQRRDLTQPWPLGMPDNVPAKVNNAPAVVDWKTQPQYEYIPLDARNSEIRILVYNAPADDPTAPISCSLRTVSMDTSKFVSLVTLSYTWGTSDRTETILLDGRPFKVTRNLHGALRYFQKKGRDCLDKTGMCKKYPEKADAIRQKLGTPAWWIDAICINQDDLNERSSQVALMTRLYRSAKVVCVWLGEETGDSGRAMDIIRRLHNEGQSRNWSRAPGKTVQHMGPGTVPQPLDGDPTQFEDAEKDRNYRAIVNLFNRPWFTRVWIRQEVALPRSAAFYCGLEECTWEQLTFASSVVNLLAGEYRVENLHRLPLLSENSLVSCFERAESLLHLRREVYWATSQKGLGTVYETPYLRFLAVLFHLRNADATDPRDKVYAALPLANPEHTRISVDYRKTPAEVFKALAVDLSSTTLDFLSACQYSEDQSSKLPSWAPDLSKHWQFWPELVVWDAGKMPHKATNFQRSPPEALYDPGSDTLRVKGVIFDEITMISSDSATISSSNEEIRRLRDGWCDLFQQYQVSQDEANKPGRPAYSKGYYFGTIREKAVWAWRTLLPYQRLQAQRELDVIHGSPFHKSLYSSVHDIGRDHVDHTAIRVAQHYLMTTTYGDQLDREEDLGQVRRFLAGRKFAKTKFGAWGFLPTETKVGDRTCQVQGSTSTYVIRETKPGHWAVMGDASFIYGINPFAEGESPSLSDIVLV